MLGLVIFILTTLLYFVGRYFVTKPAYLRIMMGAYAAVVLVSQFYFNISLISDRCVGNNNIGMGLGVTIIPWVLVFGTVFAMLAAFPGWKQPFSNTFGYGVARLMGVNSLLYNLLKSESAGDTQTKKILHNIYSNPALFINQITPSNFDDFINASKFMFVPGASAKPEMESFRGIIKAKELVSEFVWYVLSGILVTTISYNTIVNSGCTNSVDEMKKRHAEYENDVRETQEREKTQPPPRVYYIRD